MNMRRHITLLLSLAVLAAPLLSGSATDCEESCCVVQKNACSMDAMQECPFLEAGLPVQQQLPALLSSPVQPAGLAVAEVASGHVLAVRDLPLPPTAHEPSRLCASRSIPLLV